MADHRRADRVAEAIREEVATFLREGVKDPRIIGMVTVTAVEVTRDLRSARIYVSIYGSDAERRSTFEGLESLAGHLRSRLGRSLRLRAAPEVQFRQDESVPNAARIESLLAQVREEQAAREQEQAGDTGSPVSDADEKADGERQP
jgi:ribosome-binding factor A